MEVHHHPQLHHERKPWKEYLLEGLMIFVAVMMGFIASKNEFHLKRFSSSDIIGQISAYEGTIDLLHISQDIALGYQKNITEIFLRRHFTSASLRSAFSGSPMADAETRNLSPEDLTQLGADMVLIRENTSELLTFNIRAKADAVKLLVYVKKQFDLEEE